MTIAPTSSLSLSIGTTSKVRMPASSTPATGSGSPCRYDGSVAHVGDLDRLASFGRRAPGTRPGRGGYRRPLRHCSSQAGGRSPCIATVRKPSPSRSHSVPNLASQMRVAFSSMASNTGSSVAGRAGDDLEHLGGRGLLLQQTSRSSLSSRVFSMAMTAWAAKFVTSSICLSVNGRTSWR